MMRAVISMFVFLVSISFCKNVGLISASASDLLKSFASLVSTVLIEQFLACDIVGYCDDL